MSKNKLKEKELPFTSEIEFEIVKDGQLVSVKAKALYPTLDNIRLAKSLNKEEQKSTLDALSALSPEAKNVQKQIIEIKNKKDSADEEQRNFQMAELMESSRDEFERLNNKQAEAHDFALKRIAKEFFAIITDDESLTESWNKLLEDNFWDTFLIGPLEEAEKIFFRHFKVGG